MRTRRPPRRAYSSDGFADADELAELDAYLGKMPVATGEAVAVIDLYHVAVTTFASGDRYPPGGSRADRLSGLAAKVDPRVNGRATEKRIHAHAEGRTHINFADNRFADWHGD